MLGRCRDTQEDHLGGNSNQPAGRQGIEQTSKSTALVYLQRRKIHGFARRVLFIFIGLSKQSVSAVSIALASMADERGIMVSCLFGYKVLP
jgi:hypothetical protein